MPPRQRPPAVTAPLCCVHEGVSVLVVPRGRSSGSGPGDMAALKGQVEGQEDGKALEVATALPASSIQGVALHGEATAVWSATGLEAYALIRGPSCVVTALKPLGALSFPDPPAAVVLVGSGGSSGQPKQPLGEEGKETEGAGLLGLGGATVFVAIDTRIEIHRLLPPDPKPNVGSPSRCRPPPSSSCLAFTEREGRPTHLDVHGRLLAVATDKGRLKLFDVGRHPPRQLGSAGQLTLPDASSSSSPALRSLRVNADGSWVSLLASRRRLHHRGYDDDEEEEEDEGEGEAGQEGPVGLFLYDVGRDAVVPHEFGAMAVSAHVWDARDPRLLACEYVQAGAGSSSSSTGPLALAEGKAEGSGAREVATLFIPPSIGDDGSDMQGTGVVLLDSFPLQPPLRELVGLCVPRLYLTGGGSDDKGNEEEGVGLLRRTMRAFVGLDYDAMDEAAQAALRAFHSHLLRNDLPAAYRAGASLRNPLVWENMARLCVQARNLAAAELCLGRMGHARGLRAVRQAKEEERGEASALVPLAMAAVQLGMPDAAARLYDEARRPDLLLRLLVARGRWPEALALADGFDPVGRRRAHFEYAVHLEALGEWEEAARHYEVAGAQHRETPRMLLQSHPHDPAALARYVAQASSDAAASPAPPPRLLRWWAGHCETQGRFAEAKAAYRRAGAWADLVRLACYEGDLAAAEAVIAEQEQAPGRRRGGGDGGGGNELAAACFRLAQHLEGQEHDVLRAIEYYAKAGRYNHCVRLARAHELDGEVTAYALKGPASLMRDCARHFARGRQVDRALQLYTKARDWGPALALCLGALGREGAGTVNNKSSSAKALPAHLLEGAREIAQGLLADCDTAAPAPADVDPDMVGRLAEVMERQGHAGEAVRLHLLRLAYCSSLSSSSSAATAATAAAEATDPLCLTHEVTLTEGMIDRLLLSLPPSSRSRATGESEDEGKREEERKHSSSSPSLPLLLREAAAVCSAQGNHASASRLFTQAGDRRQGLECLFPLGDADGIIRYTRAARQPELFLLAAQHLRASGAWRRDEGVRAAIAEFLSRAPKAEEEGLVRAFEEESGRCRMLMKHV